MQGSMMNDPRVEVTKSDDQLVYQAVKEGNLEALKKHYRYNTSWKYSEKEDGVTRSKLLLAAQKNDLEIMKFLLSQGSGESSEAAALHEFNEMGQNPLTTAIANGNESMVALMVNHPYFYQKCLKDKRGKNPFHYLYIENLEKRKAIATILIKSGMDIHRVSDSGRLPIKMDLLEKIHAEVNSRFSLSNIWRAFKIQCLTLVPTVLLFSSATLFPWILLTLQVLTYITYDRYTKEARKKFNRQQLEAEFINYVERGKLTQKIIDEFKAKGFSINQPNYTKKPILHFATNPAMLELLIINGAALGPGEPLRMAIRRNDMPSFRLLLDLYNVNLGHPKTLTFLYEAIIHHRSQMVKALLDKGALTGKNEVIPVAMSVESVLNFVGDVFDGNQAGPSLILRPTLIKECDHLELAKRIASAHKLRYPEKIHLIKECDDIVNLIAEANRNRAAPEPAPVFIPSFDQQRTQPLASNDSKENENQLLPRARTNARLN